MSSEKILVTGATGQLGSRIVQQLLATLPPSSVVAGGRKAEKAAALTARGVEFRTVDYDSPASLDAAMQGITRVVLVSGTDVGRRVPQHQAAIEAAARAGVRLLAYTSILRGGANPIQLAVEHGGTEQVLAKGALPYILLRNGWYTENYTGTAALVAQVGVLQTCAVDGRFATASRDDYAAAAAALIQRNDHAPGQAYELAGSSSFTKQEFAELLSRKTGRPVVVQQMSEAEYAAALAQIGLPEPVARMVANSDALGGQGWLFDDSRTLEKAIGRPTTTLEQSLDAALAAPRS